jgi:hypothetical protein
MTVSTLRPIDGFDDVTAIQQLASRRWPESWHPGGLGWAMARGQLAEEVAIIDGPTGASAWAARGMDEPG